MEFKVGDRVEVIEIEPVEVKHGVFVGALATVTDTFGSSVNVRFDDSSLAGWSDYCMANYQLTKINNRFKLYELFEIYANPENKNRAFELDDGSKQIVTYDYGIKVGDEDISNYSYSWGFYEIGVREIQMEHLTREELLERGVVVID